MTNTSTLRLHTFENDPELRADIEALERQSTGKIRFAARDLRTGDTVAYNADVRCKTASVIKLPILVHTALAVQEGTLAWDERLTLTEAEKVGGSGVLTHLTAGLQLSLHDACMLMTILSDNTATNMVIEHLSIEAINARMRTLGLPITTCFRKSYAPDTEASREFGLGVSTANEMCALLTSVADTESDKAAVHHLVLQMLAEQQYTDTIPRLLPPEWKYAGKTGAIDAVRNDVGIVTSPDGSQVAIALFCQELPAVLWTADNPGMVALARLSRRMLIG